MPELVAKQEASESAANAAKARASSLQDELEAFANKSDSYDEAILKALRRLLQLTPCTICDVSQKLLADFFSSPQEALEKARSTAYDLVLSDYRMPLMNGVQFLKSFREIQPETARLILSGYADLNGLIGAINEAGIIRVSLISRPAESAN